VVRSNSSHTLTPAQHALVRRQIALIPVYGWLIHAWQIFVSQLPIGTPGPETHVFRDFVYFYVVGGIARARDLPALYSMDMQDAIIRRLVPAFIDTHFPPSYGPQVALFFAPLARLPYVTALRVWLAFTVVLYLACSYVIWRRCSHLRDQKWTAFVLLMALPALHFDLSYAQTAVLALACFTAAFVALRAGRPAIAGLAIGSLVYKPQLGLAAAVVFLYAREWRVVAGALLGAGAQLGAGILYWGPSVLYGYAGALRRIPSVMELIEPEEQQMHSWRAFFQVAGLSPGLVWGATVVASALTLVAACRCWRADGPLAVRYSALLIATVLVNPHMYVYDLLILTPLFLVLWDWTRDLGALPLERVWRTVPAAAQRFSLGATVIGVLFVCAASPLLGPIVLASHIQFSVLGLSVLLGVLTLFLHQNATNTPIAEPKLSCLRQT
jgi:hypothetical protein